MASPSADEAGLASVGQQQALFKEADECRQLIRAIADNSAPLGPALGADALAEAMAPPGAGTPPSAGPLWLCLAGLRRR